MCIGLRSALRGKKWPGYLGLRCNNISLSLVFMVTNAINLDLSRDGETPLLCSDEYFLDLIMGRFGIW